MNLPISVVHLTSALVCLTPQVSDSKADRENKIQQVRKVQRDFLTAFEKGPQAAVTFLERVLAEEALVTEGNGETRNKAEF
ncbi:MAG: hypothetical protein HY040_21015 [Planctomycetes bacterium]|nr:hypothetical protein [Planctomycetota bacterium]